MISSDLGDLGFGFKSFRKIGSIAKKVGGKAVSAGKVGFKVASMPAAVAKRVANATAGLLCKDGASNVPDPASAGFCRAMKLKDQVALKKFLPGAAAVASKVSAAKRNFLGLKQKASAVKTAYTMSDPDTNLLASLDGADPADLAFALSEVTPGDLGAVLTKDNVYLFGPSLIAVGAGLWMLFRSE